MHGRHVVIGAWLVGALLASPVAAAEPKLDHATLFQSVDADGKVLCDRLSKTTGWKTVRGFQLQVELKTEAGNFSPRGIGGPFRTGDEFRLKLTAATDLYLLILTCSARGEPKLLVPGDGEAVPHVRREAVYRLPETGVLKFKAPAGKDELILIASPVPLPWVAAEDLLKLPHGFVLDQELLEMIAEIDRHPEAGEPTASAKGGLPSALKEKARNRMLMAIKSQREPPLHSLTQASAAIAEGRLKGAEVELLDEADLSTLVMLATRQPDTAAVIVHRMTLEHR